MHLHFSRIHCAIASAPLSRGFFAPIVFRSLIKTLLSFYCFYCPIFNVFYCAGHCIITLALPPSSMTLRPSVAMLHDI